MNVFKDSLLTNLCYVYLKLQPPEAKKNTYKNFDKKYQVDVTDSNPIYYYYTKLISYNLQLKCPPTPIEIEIETLYYYDNVTY